MTMVPLSGMLTSAAGVALSQTSGSETERSQKDASAQSHGADTDLHAEQSAGIGQTRQDEESSDRDADGRRLWEKTAEPRKKQESTAEQESDPRQSKDPTGLSGTRLDLTG